MIWREKLRQQINRFCYTVLGLVVSAALLALAFVFAELLWPARIVALVAVTGYVLVLWKLYPCCPFCGQRIGHYLKDYCSNCGGCYLEKVPPENGQTDRK